jgi:peroxiredoxin
VKDATMTTKTPHRTATSGQGPAQPGPHPKRKPGAVASLRQAETRRHRRNLIISIAAVLAVVGVVTAMMLSSRPTTSAKARTAPTFTLPDTAGNQVSLASFRGKNVVLYFNEGAGCGSCLQQMGSIEKDGAFAKAGVTVLPIVMNTRDQIMHDMNTYGVKTPFLLDDGTVSKAYGTLGKGMHEGLPGHSFVLIDKTGTQRWYGEYPSMWLSPSDLLTQVNKHLPAA